MNRQATRLIGAIRRHAPVLLLLATAAQMLGCEVNGFLDPTKVGGFRTMPTLVPILDRIDVIEGRDDFWGQISEVTSEDLMPSDLTYRLAPGDAVTVEIFELQVPGQVWVKTLRIDSTGGFRIPGLGDMPAAGLSAQEFQASIENALRGSVANPTVNVTVEEGVGFQYTIYGFVQSGGVYQLRRPDLRVIDALAIAGGLSPAVYKVYVIRRVPLTEGTQPFSGRGGAARTPSQPQHPQPPVDIETLIRQLPGEKPAEPKEEPQVNPGAVRSDDQTMIDIDRQEPVRANDEPPPVDVESLTPSRPAPAPNSSDGDSFIFLEERGEWVQVKSGKPNGKPATSEGASGPQERLFAQRVIEIPVERLKRGDSEYNIVVRPNDSIYVKEPPQGVVFLQGEVYRPGAFNLNPDDKLTLKRLLAASGGFSPLAIPERVELTRMLEGNREATVRVNLAAIYNGTEPDLYLRANDHINVGTNFLAYPLAIFRSGLRSTYGFGLVLDRNFGNDVFGAPPTNVFGQ